MPIIEIENLRKTYGNTVAVDDVSFTVEDGEIFGILGPNGAGKTTTVEILAGLRHAEHGRARVMGYDAAVDRAAVTRTLGVQLQSGELPEKLKVTEALTLYATLYDNPADPDELIERMGLEKARDTAYGKLSGGQKQRLSIALALIGNPKVAILDELTTGLDPQARRETWSLIEQVRDSGVTIILVSHFMDEAERLCDRLAVIDSGRVVAVDTPTGLVGQIQSGQQIVFHTPAPLSQQAVAELQQLGRVETQGTQIIVDGGDGLLLGVATTLDRHGVVPSSLRTGQGNLEDAFIALTDSGAASVLQEA
ncbi:MAG TPA: ABC transporter ATP-binding protein [Jiangellaceae bacterium]|nr:ABC transporter ATP-binding protein [Jiangellaceae bacterium]